MADLRQPGEAGIAGAGDELLGLAGIADLVDIALEGDPGRRIARAAASTMLVTGACACAGA